MHPPPERLALAPALAQARLLARLQLVALLAVAALALVWQVAVQRALAQYEGDASLINAAGRQRMLSQRLAKDALVMTAGDPAQRRAALARDLEAFSAIQASLVEQATSDPAEVWAPLTATIPHGEALVLAAERLLASDEAGEAHLAALLAAEVPFLAAMESFVEGYAAWSGRKIERLRSLERLLLFCLLAVLLAEGTLLLRPTLQRLRRSLREQQRIQAALRQKEAELARIRVEERRRVGQELHDGLGQQLAGIGLVLGSWETLLASGTPPTEADLELVQGLVAQAREQTRALASGMRMLALHVDDAGEGLEALAERVQTLFGLEVDVELGPLPPLPPSVVEELLHIASEASMNAIRHSGGQSLRLRLEVEGEGLVLSAEDDGVGLPEDRSAGMGLEIMAERARRLGARFQLSTGEGERGTLVRCVLPLERVHGAES